MASRPQVGDLVSTTLTGETVDIDHDLGYVYLRGCASGGHVPWVYVLQWGTKFRAADTDDD